MNSNLWRFVRIPKAVALLAFFLPWMTVSCSGQKIAEASGTDLVMGKIRPLMADAAKAAAPGGEHINYYLVLAIVLIVVGLALGFAAKRYAPMVIATSVGAALLILVGTSQYSSKIAEAAAKANPNGSSGMGGDMDKMGQMAASMIRVDWQIGYWITLIALAAAAALAFFAMREPDNVGRDPDIG